MSGLRGAEETFCHQAFLYQDDGDYVAGVVPFVLDGLSRGEAVAVTVPTRRSRLLEKALGTASARVRFIDVEHEGRNPARLIPAVLHAFLDEHPEPVRVVGEPVWPERSREEYAACVQHEAMVNRAFTGRRATFLCPYEAALGPRVLDDAEATHPLVVDADGVRRSRHFSPEVAYDRYNLPLPTSRDAFLVPFDIETLSKARRVATEFAARAGIEEERLEDVALAVGEVCANSVQHGGGHGELAVWSDDEGVVFQVSDAGIPSDRLAGRRPPTMYRHGGRGLFLVNQVADLVRTHVAADGMTTRVRLRYDGTPRAAV
ncbi:sensor histidine kinase [Saccharomonospora xinjiangensis]|uniref:sensor histidine kinase n=1 Tax=Saccharomonospora xinjiangensis TaxID=75294 RepID=UPI001070191B|nr:sensor histidine kinase [Saccharomonospora xinjiangensis]QBQ59701.1 serine-protein kinase RsbW [Saccharomonospora xinjiangensis]